MRSGLWSERILGYHDGVGYTIRDALHYWYWNVSDTGEGVAFRDTCSTPHCSNSCPEEIVIEDGGTAGKWPVEIKAVITLAVLLVTVACLVLKVNY